MRTETLVQTSQFAAEGRKHKITSLNTRLHKLNEQFGRGQGEGRQSLVSARYAMQSGMGEWTDRYGRRHKLERSGSDYTERVYVPTKLNLGRERGGYR